MAAEPAEVQALGRELIDVTNERMSEVRRSLGFDGSRAEFHRALASDPRFFARTAEEVGERLLSYVGRIEPRIDEVFARRPSTPYAVERLSPDLERTSTYGYFQAPSDDHPRSVYYFNGSNLDQRSLIAAQSLIYHELIPRPSFRARAVA